MNQASPTPAHEFENTIFRPQGPMLLLKIQGEYLDRDALHAALSGIAQSTGIDSRMVHLCHAEAAPETYAYWPVPADREAQATAIAQQMQAALGAMYEGAQAVLLEATQGIRGASADAAPAWHYVVETDVQPEAEDDFNNWYSREHMPGLASVPGTVLAARLHNPGGAPRYHALYLLHTRETFGSPPWLAVRATDWSSRVRPNFTNTKRTMFRIVPPQA